MAYKTYALGSIARLDVGTMHHFEADVRFIRASEEYRILGRHPDPDRTSVVGYQGYTLWSAKLAALLFEPLVWPS